jgi:hypothetical protein
VSREPQPTLYRELTVARVRSPEGADHIEVVFFESPQIFRLLRQHPRFDELVERLRKGQPMHVGLAALDSDVIMDVRLR